MEKNLPEQYMIYFIGIISVWMKVGDTLMQLTKVLFT